VRKQSSLRYECRTVSCRTVGTKHSELATSSIELVGKRTGFAPLLYDIYRSNGQIGRLHVVLELEYAQDSQSDGDD
jgi:hypothetical protein